MAASEGCAESLFSYGTLQLAAVQVATFGRRLEGTSDTLREFDLVSLEIEDPRWSGSAARRSIPWPGSRAARPR
jgi:hypothetical protein